jgi:hypothetical protein
VQHRYASSGRPPMEVAYNWARTFHQLGSVHHAQVWYLRAIELSSAPASILQHTPPTSPAPTLEAALPHAAGVTSEPRGGAVDQEDEYCRSTASSASDTEDDSDNESGSDESDSAQSLIGSQRRRSSSGALPATKAARGSRRGRASSLAHRTSSTAAEEKNVPVIKRPRGRPRGSRGRSSTRGAAAQRDGSTAIVRTQGPYASTPNNGWTSNRSQDSSGDVEERATCAHENEPTSNGHGHVPVSTIAAQSVTRAAALNASILALHAGDVEFARMMRRRFLTF